ncbi:MAG: alpha amylase C-terminal domain-containing protein, partial [Thiopseudomonas sp.]
DYNQSVLTFARHGDTESLVCVFNFTPVPRERYRIGLPGDGEYREIFNSDSSLFGGGDVGNGGALKTDRHPWMGQPVSASLTLPPLGCVVFKRKQNKAQASAVSTEP